MDFAGIGALLTGVAALMTAIAAFRKAQSAESQVQDLRASQNQQANLTQAPVVNVAFHMTPPANAPLTLTGRTEGEGTTSDVQRVPSAPQTLIEPSPVDRPPQESGS